MCEGAETGQALGGLTSLTARLLVLYSNCHLVPKHWMSTPGFRDPRTSPLDPSLLLFSAFPPSSLSHHLVSAWPMWPAAQYSQEETSSPQG